MEDRVKVICRFRPLNQKEINEQPAVCVDIKGNSVKTLGPGQGKEYTFDKVFDQGSSQSQVYESSAKEIIESVLQGFNGTIIAYGQTSSGKTYTMMGDINDEDNRGIIPRMVLTVFESISSRSENIEFNIKVSYCEIYQEKFLDLLDTKKSNLDLRQTPSGFEIINLTHCNVDNPEKIYKIMVDGNKNRKTAETKMNKNSSRSHSIFSITVTQINNQTTKVLCGKLFLVDLAGSENANKTGAEGVRLQEGSMINKSLVSLGNVIRALTDPKHPYVNYRDSVLTKILSQSLGGNAKTSLIIACSPSITNKSETINTMKFGSDAKIIKNKPKINVEKTISELKHINLELNEENLKLKKELQLLKGEPISDVDHNNINDEEKFIIRDEIQKEIDQLNDRIQYLGDENSNLLKEKEELQKNLKDLEFVSIENQKLTLFKKETDKKIDLLQSENNSLQNSNEEYMKHFIEFKDEIDLKNSEISKLQSELNKKVYASTRSISMNFICNKTFELSNNEFERLENNLEQLQKENQEIKYEKAQLEKQHKQEINKINDKTNKIYKKYAQIKAQLDDNFDRNYSELTNDEKFDVMQKSLKSKHEREKIEWESEKEEIIKNLTQREEQVKKLESLLGYNKSSVDTNQRKMNLEEVESSSIILELKNKIHDLNFSLLKEQNRSKKLKIQSEVFQKKLDEAIDSRNHCEKVIKDLSNQIQNEKAKKFNNLKNIEKFIKGGEVHRKSQSMMPDSHFIDKDN